MVRLLLLSSVLLISITSKAQQYTTAAGIRLGEQIGLTVQQHIGKSYTLEAMAHRGFLNSETTVAALAERHINILGRRANIYIGAGPHASFYKTGNILDKSSEWQTALGMTAIGGVELRLMRTVFSIDYKPMINLSNGKNIYNGQTGLSIRYVLIDAPRKKAGESWPFGKKKSKKEGNKLLKIFSKKS